MEEEYRLHKTTASEDLDGAADDVAGAADDDASTAGLRSPPLTPSEIPTIRISSESTRGPVQVKLEKPETAQASEEPRSPLVMNGDEPLSAFLNKRLCERWLGTSWNDHADRTRQSFLGAV